jgi:mono/diheme cytochrome c family protein
MPISKFVPVTLFILSLLLAACGTVATPEWMGATQAALESQDIDEENVEVAQALEEASTDTPEPEVEPSVTPTAIPPTATPIPATEAPTEIPPTNTPTPIGAAAEASGEDGGAVTGDPAAGDTLFRNGSGAAIACTTCHMPDSDMTLVGPGLLGVSEHMHDRDPNMTAVEYLHQSIVEPDAFVVPNFPPGVMPQTYSQTLTEEQINDLVAYLMTL